MPLGTSRRTLTAVAVSLTVACLALVATPAFAAGVRSQEWWLRSLHVTKAWQSTRGAGVTVAVLDTGVDRAQADLAGSVTSGPDYTKSGRGRGGPYWGVHGTEVASIIAGHGHGRNHDSGIMGVAPAARILSVRVTLASKDPLLADPAIAGRLPSAIAHGIRYAVKHGAAVIDLPLDPVTTPGAKGAGGSAAEHNAVNYALAHNVVLVAPAGDGGNGADTVNYPAAYRGVISVGAFNSNFIKAAFSSHRPYVTLTAAGAGMVAATPPSGYTTVSSTSAASAVVTGIVALIRARFPRLSPSQVRTALIKGTVYRPPGGRSDGSGYGTADAARALAVAASLAPARSTPATSAPSATPTSAVPAPGAAGHGAGNLTVLLAGAGIALAALLALTLVVVRMRRRRRSGASRPAGRGTAGRTGARHPSRAAAPSSPGQAGYPSVPAGAAVGGTSRPGGRAGPGRAGSSPGDRRPATGAEAIERAVGRAFPASAFPASQAGTQDGMDADADAPGGPRAGGTAGTGHSPGGYRAGTERRPKVSGGPPWGPAPRPDSELPWTREAATPPVGSEPLPHRYPSSEGRSVWDTIAEEVWPGGPGVDQRGPRFSPTSGPAQAESTGDVRRPAQGHPASEGEALPPSRDAGRAVTSGPQHGQWNPGAATETFTAVPPRPSRDTASGNPRRGATGAHVSEGGQESGDGQAGQAGSQDAEET